MRNDGPDLTARLGGNDIDLFDLYNNVISKRRPHAGDQPRAQGAPVGSCGADGRQPKAAQLLLDDCVG
jgi:hypothetical protein